MKKKSKFRLQLLSSYHNNDYFFKKIRDKVYEMEKVQIDDYMMVLMVIMRINEQQIVNKRSNNPNASPKKG